GSAVDRLRWPATSLGPASGTKIPAPRGRGGARGVTGGSAMKDPYGPLLASLPPSMAEQIGGPIHDDRRKPTPETPSQPSRGRRDHATGYWNDAPTGPTRACGPVRGVSSCLGENHAGGRRKRKAGLAVIAASASARDESAM